MTEFKYAPKGIPPLTEEQWETLEKIMSKPMTKEEKEMWRRAKEIFKNIKQKSKDIRIRKVKVLQGRAREEAEKLGLNPNDLVIVTTNHIEKIDGDPVSYLLKRAKQMKIKLWITPKNKEKFIEALRELCREHAVGTEERALDGTLQEKGPDGTVWFFKVEKEKRD